MTNQEYIIDNKIPFSNVLKYWANVGHLEDWLLKKHEPIFKPGDIIYSKYNNIFRKVVYVGKKYYITMSYLDGQTKGTGLSDEQYNCLIDGDDDMKKFIDGYQERIHYASLYEYEMDYDKIGIAL